MTQFDKTKFDYHGGYLTYEGTYEGQPKYDELWPDCHPSRRGKPVELLVGRFKYSGAPITKARFLKELLKQEISVEDYAAKIENGKTPVDILEEKNPDWYERYLPTH